MEGMGNMTNSFKDFALIKEVGDCMGFVEELDDGKNMEEQIPSRLAKWTMKYLPAPLIKALSIIYAVATVSVSANVIEAYLYLRIFQKMKR